MLPSLLVLVFICFGYLFQTVSGTCGYVDITAKLASFFTVGEFILSEDKCQSISAELNVMGSKQTAKGAIKFSCDSTNTNTLIIQQYTNMLCTGNPQDTTTIKVGTKASLWNTVDLTLNSFVCADTDCGIDITFSADCTATDSIAYSNIVIPPNSCQSFGDDFKNVLQPLPYEIFPDASVNGLFNTALEFTCCEQDHSLLIYNYSDSNCLSSTAYNTLRLSNEYNGQCFVMGNKQKPFDIGNTKVSTNDVNTDDDVYALRYTWNCDTFVDCTGIELMDDAQIPNLCPDQCLQPGYVIQPPTTTTTTTVAPTTIKPTVAQRPIPTASPDTMNPTFNPTWSPTLSPTSAPTFHPIPSSDDHAVTVRPQGVIDGTPESNIATIYFWIGLLSFCAVIGVIVLVYCAYRKQTTKRMMEETQRESIQEKDTRYETMKVDVTSGSKKEAVKDSKPSVTGDYVLPSKTNDRDESQNAMTLLSEK